jgi:hypothetical protein
VARSLFATRALALHRMRIHLPRHAQSSRRVVAGGSMSFRPLFALEVSVDAR